MKYTHISRSYIFLLSCMLFGSSQVLPVAPSDLNDNESSINQSLAWSYVCFDKSRSNIADVITQISALDTDLNSPISQLKHHIDNGYMLGLRDEVLDVLEYAEWFVARHTDEKVKGLVAEQLDKVIEQVLQGELDISKQEIMRSSDLRLIINSKARFKEDVRMDKKLYVHGKAHFDNDVEFKDDVKIKDDLTVKGDVVVEGTLSASDVFITDISVGDATISGTLSVQEEVVGCDLTVGCNINMNNSTSAAIGNINKGGTSFIHNFGTDNTFVGDSAGNFFMNGSSNTGFGVNTLATLDQGNDNTAVGYEAMRFNVDGGGNVAVGFSALRRNTSDDNTAVGADALTENDTGTGNSAVGSGALQLNVSGNFNTALGVFALNENTVSNNTAVGFQALTSNTTGEFNTAVGANALSSNTTGHSNIAIGTNALTSNVTGESNVAIGTDALSNFQGESSVAIGYKALEKSPFFENTAIGAFALSSTIGSGRDNTAVGVSALSHNTTGIGNTGIGHIALRLNTTGGFNVAVGGNALTLNKASSNTAIGNSAMLFNTTGFRNTAIGQSALERNQTGDHNIGIGFRVGLSLVAGSNNIYIDGSGALNPADESDTIRIGNSQINCFIAGIRTATTGVADAIPVLIDSNGQLGTVSSSKRFKHNIEGMKNKSERIYDLNPVEFIYNKDASETKQYGLIAEEVAQVFPELVVNEQDGTPYTVRYEVLPVLLLNEIQKQQQKINAMDQKVAKIDEIDQKITMIMEQLRT